MSIDQVDLTVAFTAKQLKIFPLVGRCHILTLCNVVANSGVCACRTCDGLPAEQEPVLAFTRSGINGYLRQLTSRIVT